MSKIPDLKVRTQDCVRAANGRFTDQMIRAACNRGEIIYERDVNGIRLISIKSFMMWVKRRDREGSRHEKN